MERTFASFIIGSFLLALFILFGLIMGIENAIHHLQHHKINANFDNNINLLASYIRNEDDPLAILKATDLLELAKVTSAEDSYHQKRLVIAESGLIISEYYLEKLMGDGSGTMINTKWIVQGSNAYWIAALHQYISLEPYQKEIIKRFTKTYDKYPEKKYEMAKMSSEIFIILSTEIPRLRSNFQKINSGKG